jgi:chromosome segregation protein
LENFKSFGKKERVPFFPGFTAITGPNGSGKSNISDAILFVLGPKSSKVIRAGKLTDLIFNGGKKRKNPAKYCEVSLVFDNVDRKMPIDCDDVILTRRVKRAPVKDNLDNYYSYFYVNGRSASLSDFIDLLTHARISGDGYNLVKQGDITSLVEMGAVERRKIIDDITGVSTFDKDIEKAEKERIVAEENIKRISIVLDEIDKQFHQLKKDRDEAARYKELRDSLYENKAKLTFKKKQDINAQISEIQRQIESYEKERKKLENGRDKLRKDYKKARELFAEVEQKIAEIGGDESRGLKEKIDHIRMNFVKVEEKINYVKDEIFDLNQEEKEISINLSKVQKNISEYEDKKNELSNTISIKEQELTEKETIFTELKEKIAHSDDASMDLSRELIQMREEYNEKQNQLHEFKLTNDRFEKKLEILNSKIAELEETHSTYEFEIKDIDWQLEEISKGRKNIYQNKEKLERKLFGKKEQESELAEQLRNLEDAIKRLQREYSQVKTEKEAAESVLNGYTNAVRAILAERDSGKLKGIHGTIAELANVDKKYETAIGMAAGPRLQSLVIDDDGVAAEAINFLRKNNLGRATFLPLNKMIIGKPRGKALMTINDEKSHGFALDLIKFGKEYRAAFWYVFGDTVIVEDLNTARRLMGGVRLVDLRGDLIEASGAMKGGSDPKSSVVFSGSHRESFDELSRKLKDAVNSQDSVSKELSKLKVEIEKIERNLRSYNDQLDSVVNVSELEIRKKEFAGKLKILKKDLESNTKEHKNLITQQKEIQEHIDECKSRISELDKFKEEKTKLLFRGSKKELAQEARGFEEQILSLKKSIADLNSQHETLLKQIELVNERKNEMDSRLNDIQKNIEKQKALSKDLKQDANKHRAELEALMNVESKLSGKIKGLTGKRDKVYRDMVSLETELDKIGTRIESYVDLISRAQYRLPTLEETVTELQAEFTRFDIGLADNVALPNINSLNESIKLIEENMRELEPVNMRALEEYEHQSERKNKLYEDVKHLKGQKKNLVRLVKEVSKKKKDRFYDVFEEINNNFREVYARLSEGGEAELLLENPEDPFAAGLTIKARPRGKKILYLSALSGGEKSMASLALIFAVQQYDPSPFYVLDEVDMFLDGVNAESVSRMIKDNSTYAQFIVVSLRKIALQGADHVYGVTMQEDGITEMIGRVDVSSIGHKGEINMSSPGG